MTLRSLSLRSALLGTLAVSSLTPAGAAEPLGCAAIPMAPPEAARISFPVPAFSLSNSGAAFSKAMQDALNVPLARAGVLGRVSGLNVYRAVTPDEMARMQGEGYLRSEGWKAALAGSEAVSGMVPLGEGRWVGVYSDGKADVVVRVEPAPGWPRADVPGPDADRMKLRELASRGEAVVYRFEGRGIAKAACAGELPEIVGGSPRRSAPGTKPS